MLIDNLILERPLGKGSFGQVYLTKKKGDNNIYATKVYEREKIEGTEAFKYLTNEINILHELKHPNIVKFIEVKKTKKHYYIVMEYCNGGELEKALEKYQLKYGKPFPEEVVQYLMRQIIDAFNYIHGKNVMHRDIKLENILLHFENEEDRKNLNMMKAIVKIIDFGFACKIAKNALTFTTIGNPMNMDPLILKKLTSHGKIRRELGYDQKADIWSLGAICYQMLIGKAAFDADDMDQLVNKIEEGKYNVPTNLSKEVVSFLNGMLQYDSKMRLTAQQLHNHQFIQGNIKDFHKIDLNQVSGKVKKGELVIDTKKNKSIWAIFNKEDEDKLIKISPGHLASIPEEMQQNGISSQKTLDNERMMKNNNNNIGQPIKNINTYQPNNYPNMYNMNNYNQNYSSNYNNPYYGPVLPSGGQGIPGNYSYPNNPNNNNPPSLSNQPMTETNYIFSGGIYSTK